MVALIKRGIVALCLLSFVPSAFAAVAPDFMDKLTSDSRPADDRARDGARRPYQVMQLLGVDAGMTVVDIGAGAGWYTRVLSAAVGPRGKVISQAGPRAMQRGGGAAQREMAQSLGNVEVSFENAGDMDANVADVAVTALNLHHMDDERGKAAMRDVLHVLKPGGVAAVIDHVGMPGIDMAQQNMLHRIPIDTVRGWIQAAGLEIVSEPTILRTTADDHTLSVFDPILGRNTDRFFFLVRKPK